MTSRLGGCWNFNRDPLNASELAALYIRNTKNQRLISMSLRYETSMKINFLSARARVITKTFFCFHFRFYSVSALFCWTSLHPPCMVKISQNFSPPSCGSFVLLFHLHSLCLSRLQLPCLFVGTWNDAQLAHELFWFSNFFFAFIMNYSPCFNTSTTCSQSQKHFFYFHLYGLKILFCERQHDSSFLPTVSFSSSKGTTTPCCEIQIKSSLCCTSRKALFKMTFARFNLLVALHKFHFII